MREGTRMWWHGKLCTLIGRYLKKGWWKVRFDDGSILVVPQNDLEVMG